MHGNYDIAKWCKTLPDGGVKDDVEAVLKLKEEDHKMAVKKMGIACGKCSGSYKGPFLKPISLGWYYHRIFYQGNICSLLGKVFISTIRE